MSGTGRVLTPWRFGDVGRFQRCVEGGEPYWITVSWLHVERGWVNVGTGLYLPEQPSDDEIELLIRGGEPMNAPARKESDRG